MRTTVAATITCTESGVAYIDGEAPCASLPARFDLPATALSARRFIDISNDNGRALPRHQDRAGAARCPMRRR